MAAALIVLLLICVAAGAPAAAVSAVRSDSSVDERPLRREPHHDSFNINDMAGVTGGSGTTFPQFAGPDNAPYTLSIHDDLDGGVFIKNKQNKTVWTSLVTQSLNLPASGGVVFFSGATPVGSPGWMAMGVPSPNMFVEGMVVSTQLYAPGKQNVLWTVTRLPPAD
ncbi:hypothetical protein HYH03_009901 [Edaphochlamys debaryana]|uniref:Uncharacterized protein n=1 Tax=Edaphochlamys debaryana TaxID=47281 RepID=A0A835XZ85_9CHLO|nr:hypothetical protein HYH03_009901 [Edaphochlamys debaryana]|eukprot:KAG2491738.1 hypothetical protein HYH03_009901 [Edaphochlamys debaryana]